MRAFRILILSFALAAGHAASIQAQDAPIFDLNQGLTDYYLQHKSIEPMMDFRDHACPPGVSDISENNGATPTPCGGTGAGPIAPINPCSVTASCGPGVGLESGYVFPAPEQWNIHNALKR
jgi:hypothetical protein